MKLRADSVCRSKFHQYTMHYRSIEAYPLVRIASPTIQCQTWEFLQASLCVDPLLILSTSWQDLSACSSHDLYGCFRGLLICLLLKQPGEQDRLLGTVPHECIVTFRIHWLDDSLKSILQSSHWFDCYGSDILWFCVGNYYYRHQFTSPSHYSLLMSQCKTGSTNNLKILIFVPG